MIFTWRAIRTTPGESQRRRPKRRLQSDESSSSAAATDFIPHEDSGVQDVVDQFFQSGKVIFSFYCTLEFFIDLVGSVVKELSFFFFVQPTLGQIVRQRLSEGRKVNCLSALVENVVIT